MSWHVCNLFVKARLLFHIKLFDPSHPLSAYYSSLFEDHPDLPFLQETHTVLAQSNLQHWWLPSTWPDLEFGEEYPDIAELEFSQTWKETVRLNYIAKHPYAPLALLQFSSRSKPFFIPHSLPYLETFLLLILDALPLPWWVDSISCARCSPVPVPRVRISLLHKIMYCSCSLPKRVTLSKSLSDLFLGSLATFTNF